MRTVYLYCIPELPVRHDPHCDHWIDDFSWSNSRYVRSFLCSSSMVLTVSRGDKRTFRNFHNESYQSSHHDDCSHYYYYFESDIVVVVVQLVVSILRIHGYHSIHPSTNTLISMIPPEHRPGWTLYFWIVVVASAIVN